MTDTREGAPHTRWPFAIVFGIAGALVVGIVVLAFVWPGATAEPRDLPVGIAGPKTQVTAVQQAVEKQGHDPFRFVAVRSRTDAVERIRDRELYGAVLLGDSPEVLTSSAASSVSNQALRAVAAQLQQQIASGVEQALAARLQEAGRAVGGLQEEVSGLQQQVAALQRPLKKGGGAAGAAGGSAPSAAPSAETAPKAPPAAAPPGVKLTDVVALSDNDPTGGGLTGASFPLSLGGMLGGVLVSLLVAGTFRRVLALLVYGTVAGPVLALVLQSWLQVVQRDWWVNAAAFALALTATAAVVVGFNALIGPSGIAVGAVVTLLIGNPISGSALPYQFIAGPWGEVGQYFVPGAASTLVRSLSYFPDADTGRQWAVLAAWVAAGLVLIVAGNFRAAAPVPLPAAELDVPRARRSRSAAPDELVREGR